MLKRKQRLFNILWIVIPVAAVIFALCAGRFGLSCDEVFSSLLKGPASDDASVMVVYNVRLPRILLSFLVGAGLSVAGLSFQSIFSNPLASPDTLGVSSGAAFGAVLGILFSFSIAGVQAMAILFGIAAIGITFVLSRLRPHSGILMIVLAGVISSSFFTALIALVKYVADPMTKLPEITYWLMGSMNGASYDDVMIALPLIGIPVIVLFLLRWKLNILILPDDEAVSLGIAPKKLRWIIILLSTVIIAACVSVCGQVGWIGLVIPHMVRRITGPDHRFSLPAAISIGGVYMVLVDTLARTISAGEFPISILTALIGLPIFVLLFFKKGGKGHVA